MAQPAPVSNTWATPNIPPGVLGPWCGGGEPQQWKTLSGGGVRRNELEGPNAWETLPSAVCLQPTEKRRAPVRGRPCWDAAHNMVRDVGAQMPPNAACQRARSTARRILEKQLGSQECEGEERRTDS